MRILLTLLPALFIAMSCGDTNYFQSLGDRSSEKSALEQARVEIDSKNYSEASKVLSAISSDSNEKRKLVASATLGAAGIDFWNVLKSTFDSGLSGGSFDSFIDVVDTALESTYGTTGSSSRRSALEATDTAISQLLTAPNADAADVQNMACVIAALNSIPLSSTLTASITATSTSLDTLIVDPTNPTCPDTTTLENTLSNLTTEMAFLENVLAAVKNCGDAINPQKTGSLNSIEQTFNNLLSNADQGCVGSGASCTTVGCRVSSCLTTTQTAVAGDEIVSSCEFIENCLTGNCF